MIVYAGIDEAGLGPVLGPYVVGMAVFEAPGSFETGDQDLFKVLSQSVTPRSTKKSERIVVTDSKKLFSQTSGVRRLEEALLPFYLCNSEKNIPMSLEALLHNMVTLDDDNWSDYPWYSFEQSSLGARIVPMVANTTKIVRLRDTLKTNLDAEDVRLKRLGATVVPVKAFNRSLASTGNKAMACFQPMANMLSRLWTECGSDGSIVRVDKLGSRTQYKSIIEKCVPDARVSIIREENQESRYVVEDGTRRMMIYFAMRSDAHHLPVCLASIIAKYFRERLMEVQNDWFCKHQCNLRPTAGYPQDAERWLRDSSSTRIALAVQDAILLRNR